MRTPRINWYSNHPNIYNDYLFRELQAAGIDLHVFFIEGVKNTHPWKTKMGHGFTSEILDRKFGVDFGNLFSVLSSNRTDKVLIAGWNNAHNLVLLLLLALMNREYYLWSDSINPDKERSGIKQRLRKLLVDHIIKKSSKFLITGENGRSVLAKLYNVPTSKSVNFPFATDTEFFTVTRSGPTDMKQIRFVSSGRLDFDHKGQDVMIKALGIVCRKGLKNFFLTIAGTGPDEQILRNLITRESLGENVKLLGWVEPDGLVDFYNSGDVFLHTSNFDPFPNSVMEAMACGLAVVGSDNAGSVNDRVIPCKNGFIHHAGDEEGLADILVELLSGDVAIDDLKKNARLTAEKWSVTYNIQTIKSLLVE